MLEDQLSQIDPLVTEAQAAEVLGTTRGTMRQSRHTGFLFGKPAPAFVKAGRSIRYRLSRLTAYRDEFPEYHNTSEFEEKSGGERP